ncbi:FAD-dependent oxidoreductase [Cyclobacterium amurskyense]|uniref:FAD-dependent oxidoreductase n=1 Tax=Cyclobacterium amurskyense TaxID=320787 RepID=UPI0030DAC039|tara:strand:+ start:832 stop:2469 length:1638 start_codon:yes stop_codon:yes gene_type:complete
MKFLKVLYLLTACALLNACNNEVNQNVLTTDICILGGSEAGFTAAIQASRLGKKVVLIEPTGHPGGMVVEGLGKDMRFGNARVIGGIAREFYEKVEAHYGLKAEFENPKWYSKYEPSIAEAVIEQMLEEEKNITIIRNTRIKEQNGVEKKGNRIEMVILENGSEIKAKVFVDASIEGHLLHFAGITTESIREGNEKYGENLNGVQEVNTFKQFTVDVDPYIIEGDSTSGLIPTIQAGELGNHGDPSHYIQGFCFRMCLTKDEQNKLPINKPEDYVSERYEIYRRYLKEGGQLFKPEANRHNGKTDIGSWHDLSANLYGENWEYPQGDYEKQDSIIQYHRSFTLGLLWFLQNDESVDSLTRANWEGWGLPKDEFTDNGNWPRRLYIRSGRRMVSEYVITEHNVDIKVKDTVSDPIAIAWWPPDVHHARRIVKDGKAYNEGFTHVENDGTWKPFKISFQATVPKKDECINVLTPTCLSSSYVGYGSIRIVPTFMIMGQSVGAAATIAVNENLDVQDIPFPELEKVLLSQNQLLALPDDWLEIITKNN